MLCEIGQYLAELWFAKGTWETYMYLKEIENGLLIVDFFVVDIIFGGDDEAIEALWWNKGVWDEHDWWDEVFLGIVDCAK